jgi:hypothetical protein
MAALSLGRRKDVVAFLFVGKAETRPVGRVILDLGFGIWDFWIAAPKKQKPDP